MSGGVRCLKCGWKPCACGLRFKTQEEIDAMLLPPPEDSPTAMVIRLVQFWREGGGATDTLLAIEKALGLTADAPGGAK